MPSSKKHRSKRDSGNDSRGVSTVIGVAILTTLTIALATGLIAYSTGFVNSGAKEPPEFNPEPVVDEHGHVVIHHSDGENVDPERLKVKVTVQQADGSTVSGTIEELPSDNPRIEESQTKGSLKFDNRYGAVTKSMMDGEVAANERIGFSLANNIDPRSKVTITLIDRKTNHIVEEETVVPENKVAQAPIPDNFFESAVLSSDSQSYISNTKTKYSKTSPGEDWEKVGINNYDQVLAGYYYTTSRYDPGPEWTRDGIDHYEQELSGYKYTTSSTSPGSGWEKTGVSHYESYVSGYDYKWFDDYSTLSSQGYTLVDTRTQTWTEEEWQRGWHQDTYTETYTEYKIVDKTWHSGYYTTDRTLECDQFLGYQNTENMQSCHWETSKTWVSGYYTYDRELVTETRTVTEWDYGWYLEEVQKSDTDYKGQKATYDSYAVYEWRKATYDTYAVYDWKKPDYNQEPVYEWKKVIYDQTEKNLAYNGDSSYTIAENVEEMQSGSLTIKDDKLVTGSDAFTVTANGESGSQSLTVAKTSTGGIKVIDNGNTVWKGSADKVELDLEKDRLVIHSGSGTTSKSVNFDIGPETDEEIGTYTLKVDSGDKASGSYEFALDGDVKV